MRLDFSGHFLPMSLNNRFLKSEMGSGLEYYEHGITSYDCKGAYEVNVTNETGKCLQKNKTGYEMVKNIGLILFLLKHSLKLSQQILQLVI